MTTLPYPHGTRTGYTSHACRCEHCTETHREYMRVMRQRLKERGLPEGDLRHGTTGAYRNWGCRCAACVKANSQDCAMRKARRRLWAN